MIVLEHDRVTNVELQLRRKDGSVFWGAVNAQVVRDASGAVAYFDCTMEDITARKQAEKLLHDANQRLQAIIQASRVGHYRGRSQRASCKCGIRRPSVYLAGARLKRSANSTRSFRRIKPDQFYQDHQRILHGEIRAVQRNTAPAQRRPPDRSARVTRRPV